MPPIFNLRLQAWSDRQACKRYEHKEVVLHFSNP
jgi:hypothetical protein